jgi:hypothetical protein
MLNIRLFSIYGAPRMYAQGLFLGDKDLGADFTNRNDWQSLTFLDGLIGYMAPSVAFYASSLHKYSEALPMRALFGQLCKCPDSFC